MYFAPMVGFAAFGLQCIVRGKIPEGSSLLSEDVGAGGDDDGSSSDTKAYAAVLAAASLIGSMMNGLSMLPSYIPTMSTVAALVHRVSQLLDSLQVVKALFDEERDANKLRHIEPAEIGVLPSADEARDSSSKPQPVVKVAGLTVRTPKGKPLFNSLSFEVARGEAILVAGPSGVGKSTLLRCIAGIVPIDAGVVERPMGQGQSMFVP